MMKKTISQCMIVKNEEKNIRRNKSSRGTELLRKVFAKQDTNRK